MSKSACQIMCHWLNYCFEFDINIIFSTQLIFRAPCEISKHFRKLIFFLNGSITGYKSVGNFLFEANVNDMKSAISQQPVSIAIQADQSSFQDRLPLVPTRIRPRIMAWPMNDLAQVWLKSSNDNCIWCCSVWAFWRCVFGVVVILFCVVLPQTHVWQFLSHWLLSCYS